MPEAGEPRDTRGTWIWIAMGCGGLALSALCIAPLALWLAAEDDAELAGDPPPPPPPIAPTPPGPVDPMPPPAAPFDPTLPPPPAPGVTSPRHVSAVVEEASGIDGVRPGTTCSFDVTRRDQADGTFWCNAQVRCGSVLLYGGADLGFFDCTLYEQPERHVVGEDRNTTGTDRDPAMRLDTLRRTLTVRDDAAGRLGAFSVRARVTSVR